MSLTASGIVLSMVGVAFVALATRRFLPDRKGYLGDVSRVLFWLRKARVKEETATAIESSVQVGGWSLIVGGFFLQLLAEVLS